MSTLHEWRDLARSLIALAGDMLGSAEAIPVSTKINLVARLLLARTYSNANGVILLADDGRQIEARTLVRCCIENAFWVGALIEDGGKLVEEMKRDDIKYRSKRGQFLIKAKLGVDGGFEERLRTWIRDHKKLASKPGLLKPQEVAQRGSIENLYILYETLSSDAAHPSVSSLDRHAVTNEQGQVIGVDKGPRASDSEAAETMNFLCVTMLGVLVGVNQLLGGVPPGRQLQGFASRYSQLSRS